MDSNVKENTMAHCKQQLHALAERYGLEFDSSSECDDEDEESVSELIFKWFPDRVVCHAIEQGQPPRSLYEDMLVRYSYVTSNEFTPLEIDVDSDDDWESVLVEFKHAGKQYSFQLSDVCDSDYFSFDFVIALNAAAEHMNLSGRWVCFYDGEDGCSSIYVPYTAYGEFLEVARRYSTQFG